MEKQANPGKVMAFMKSGKSPEEAVRAAYPDWDDKKVRRAAAMLKSAMSAGAIKQAAAGKKHKATFSPAMDDDPKLKGKQSTLPDHVQAAILKKKGKEKSAGVMLCGLREASSALYSNHFERNGLEKVAFWGTLTRGVTHGAGKAAAGAGALGAAAGAYKKYRELRNLHNLAKSNQSIRTKAVRDAIGTGPQAAENKKFFERAKGLDKPFAESWQEHLSAYAPAMLRSAAETGGLTALAGGALKAGANYYGKKQAVQTVKQVAPWVAGGAGAAMLLNNN